MCAWILTVFGYTYTLLNVSKTTGTTWSNSRIPEAYLDMQTFKNVNVSFSFCFYDVINTFFSIAEPIFVKDKYWFCYRAKSVYYIIEAE